MQSIHTQSRVVHHSIGVHTTESINPPLSALSGCVPRQKKNGKGAIPLVVLVFLFASRRSLSCCFCFFCCFCSYSCPSWLLHSCQIIKNRYFKYYKLLRELFFHKVLLHLMTAERQVSRVIF